MASCISYIPQLFIAFACVFYGLAGVANATSTAKVSSADSQQMYAAYALAQGDATAQK